MAGKNLMVECGVRCAVCGVWCVVTIWCRSFRSRATQPRDDLYGILASAFDNTTSVNPETPKLRSIIINRHCRGVDEHFV